MIWDTIANIPAAQLITFIGGGLALNFAPGQDVFFASACGIQNGPRAGALAGIGVGLWASREEVAAHWQLERRFEPAISDAERQHRCQRWHAAVALARAWRG